MASTFTRFEAPVDSVSARSLVKSWRVWATERFAPKVEESDFSEVSAPVSAWEALSRSESFWKLIWPSSWVLPALTRPRLSEVTSEPWMSSLVWFLPVFSLNWIERRSPCSRLMPLKLASLASWSIWSRRSLYCWIRFERTAEVTFEESAPTPRASVARLNAPLADRASVAELS